MRGGGGEETVDETVELRGGGRGDSTVERVPSQQRFQSSRDGGEEQWIDEDCAVDADKLFGECS